MINYMTNKRTIDDDKIVVYTGEITYILGINPRNLPPNIYLLRQKYINLGVFRAVNDDLEDYIKNVEDLGEAIILFRRLNAFRINKGKRIYTFDNEIRPLLDVMHTPFDHRELDAQKIIDCINNLWRSVCIHANDIRYDIDDYNDVQRTCPDDPQALADAHDKLCRNLIDMIPSLGCL